MPTEMGFTQFITISTAGQIEVNDGVDTHTDTAVETDEHRYRQD